MGFFLGKKKAFTSDKIFGEKILPKPCIFWRLQLHTGRNVVAMEFNGERMTAWEADRFFMELDLCPRAYTVSL